MNQAVIYIASHGIVNGVGGDKFNPGGKVTRAEFVAMLVRMLDLNGNSSGTQFKDVSKSKWYSDSISIAKANGIISGTGDDKFTPDSPITRQDMFTMYCKALEKMGAPLETAKSDSLNSYSDKTQISDYAVDSLSKLVSKKLVQVSENKLNPKGLSSRGECAQFLYNALVCG